MLELERAQELLLANTKVGSTEKISVLEVVGRVLAEDILSHNDYPPFDRSPLDGFAVRAEDIPGEMTVIDKIYAGDVSSYTVTEGTAVRIMTGAPIPTGANCIVRQEDVKIGGDKISIEIPHKPFENYVYKGEDIKKGNLILEKNQIINATSAMLIAALGLSEVLVYKKPTVGILSTGNELQDLDTQLQPGHIYNSNLYFLHSRLMELGVNPKPYLDVKDTMEDISSTLEKAYSECDIIISTGGVSVGEKDLVKEGAEAAGFNILYWKVNIKPGSPMFGAIREGKLLIGLSGNPLAMATSFELVMKPVLAKYFQCLEYDLKPVIATAGESYDHSTKKRRFLRVFVQNEGEIRKVYVNGVSQQPGRMLTLLKTNAIMEVKPFTKIKEGDLVEVYTI